jgi:hypothetical protein
MKRILIILSAIVLFAVESNSQNGTWSGKLDVQGIKISLVFHLDGDSPTVDSPDQGVKGIPIQVERKSFGGAPFGYQNGDYSPRKRARN